MLTSITNAIVEINDAWGYGDVRGVVLNEDYRGGKVTIKRTSCSPEERKFRYNGATKTVYFAGHQQKINKGKR